MNTFYNQENLNVFWICCLKYVNSSQLQANPYSVFSNESGDHDTSVAFNTTCAVLRNIHTPLVGFSINDLQH